MVIKSNVKTPLVNDKKVEEFITKAGKTKEINTSNKLDQKITLRIPKWLMEKIDQKRNERIGNISRNSFILEELGKSLK